MKTLIWFVAFAGLFAVAGCDRVVPLPVADARPIAAAPALHPAPAADAVVDGHVYEYSQ